MNIAKTKRTIKMLNGIYTIRYPLLIFSFIACILLWPGVKHAIQIDNSLTVWFLEDDPALLAYEEFHQNFGNDEVIILMIESNESLLDKHHFERFINMTDSLMRLSTVEQVSGPSTAQLSIKGMLGVVTQDLISETSNPDKVHEHLEQNSFLRKQLFTEDYKAARFIIELAEIADFDSKRGEILAEVKAVVRHYYTEKESAFGGIGVIYAGLNELSQRDFGLFLGLGYMIMFLLILLIYRRFSLLVYTIGTITLATYITIGLYGVLGYRINLMTTLLPIVIILLGVMDVIHVINERHQAKYAKMNAKKSALKALKKVYNPCLFTTLTTMAGFLALTTSPMAILKTFGIFCAVGILLSLVFTYLLGVIILPHSKPSPKPLNFTLKWLEQLMHFVSRYKLGLLVVSALFILTASYGLTFLVTDTDTLSYFPKNHEVVQDHERIQNTWGGYLPLEFLVYPKDSLKLYYPEMIAACYSFEYETIKKIDGLNSIFGFHSLYAPDYDSSRQALSKSAMWQRARKTQELYPVLSAQYINQEKVGRITVFGEMMSAASLNNKMDSLLQISETNLSQVAKVVPAGYQPMYAGIVNYVTKSQINSLLLAFGLIFLLVFAFIRDFKLAVLSITPNFFPILVMMGIMGWLGIRLDIATASIAAIVLSFCIDDTIHFLYTYQQYRKKGQNAADARKSTIMHVGTAIVLTSVLLFFGYSIMILASLKTVMLFGLLTSITIIGALYSHMVIFPVLLEKFDKRP